MTANLTVKKERGGGNRRELAGNKLTALTFLKGKLMAQLWSLDYRDQWIDLKVSPGGQQDDSLARGICQGLKTSGKSLGPIGWKERTDSCKLFSDPHSPVMARAQPCAHTQTHTHSHTTK